ncbi:hypothetical protein H6763_00980 [Candidatus Nomurabacteria bacterium]|nr:hypothetical protein [Candidatus Nomurabacteria bacterium]MCB9803382.1 hypothetical protein [Candidatus Nomurabacteria bacterium]
MANLVSLDQKLKKLKINKAEIDNEIVFNYFDSLPSEQRDDKFFQALYIGVLAQMEDRLSAFLAKTQNELGTELESLKMIFEMKKEIFYKTTVKGMMAEEDITEFLNNYFKEKKLGDKAETTGTMQGEIDKNKTGDILCYVDGNEDKRIAIEAKFDKSIKLGDIADKDIFTKKFDTAWSQVIEAKANRNAKVGIIVLDISLVDNSILKLTDSVAYIQGVGFIVIVDSQKGDYSNLTIAYNLARDIVLNSKEVDFDDKTLTIILKRIIKDIDTLFSIKTLVETNIRNNNEILNQLEKSLLLMQFNQEYLEKFLSDGKLSDKDLLDFYSGEEVKEKYKAIESEILDK